MSMTKGKSGRGRAKTSTRRNEQREQCVCTHTEGGEIGTSERECACANESRPEPGRYREDGRGKIEIEDG